MSETRVLHVEGITSCLLCPNMRRRHDAAIRPAHYCWHVGISIEDSIVKNWRIPDWCPLPKGEEEK